MTKERAKTSTTRKLTIVLAIALALRLVFNKLGWHPPSIIPSDLRHFDFDAELTRLFPSFVLWVIFSVYWAIAARDSAPTANSESGLSTYFHQFVLGASYFLLLFPIPGLSGWFLPPRFHFVVAVGLAIQLSALLLAVWARRHLGRNWSAEVRIGVDHQLVRTGPYAIVRHPIYTAMLGMFLGTAIASTQYHAIVALALLVLAYARKTRLEEQILSKAFGTDFDSYRRGTWALVPLLY